MRNAASPHEEIRFALRRGMMSPAFARASLAGPPSEHLTSAVVALLILVFLDAQDVGTPLPQALARAAEQALGTGATVVIRPIPAATSERELLEAGRAEKATAVARLTWSDGRRSRAELTLQVLAGDRRGTETLSFEPSDPLAERGRALGLVLAAMVAPDRFRGAEARAAPSPLAKPAPSDAAAPAPGLAATVATSDARAADAPSSGRWFLDAAVQGGIAVGGAGSGIGGTIGLGQRTSGRLGWRVGARARFGEIAAAQASSLSAGVSAGLAVTVRRAAMAGERFELDLRLEALLLYETLSHFSSDDAAAVRKGRLIPGAGLDVEARYILGPGAALVLGAGPEVAFGRTDVVVHEMMVSELVPLRVSVHGGLRVVF